MPHGNASLFPSLGWEVLVGISKTIHLRIITYRSCHLLGFKYC